MTKNTTHNATQDAPRKSSLVIVYHRQPYEEEVVDGRVVLRENKSPNGIVPTLKSFFGKVDRAAWVAWKKSPAGRAPKFERRLTVEDSYGRYEVVRLPLAPEQINQFYHVTSKEALWPILHSFPAMYSTENTDWATFREVNRLFAEAACEEAAPGAVVWVHDYNLWLVPGFVRQLRPDVRIAFFHHTPFPAPDIFTILPWRDEILDSLLACDLVGFHIPRYANNFAALVRSQRAVQASEERAVEPELRPAGQALSDASTTTSLTVAGRTVHIDAFPIGTHPSYIRELLGSEAGCAQVERIRAEAGEQKLIVSIGRVDYVKGTRQMLEAFERLLARRPELHGKLKLVITTVAAADGMKVYQRAQQQIEQLVGRVNGRYGSLSWTPILLLTTSLPFEEVVSCYRAADICWVTPLRDGLNLVAKEYVVAHEDRGGVLVLSEFTGVAVELHEAVLTNPYSRSSMDRAIDAAIDMPEAEQRERMRRLARRVTRYDMGHWTRHVMGRFERMLPARETAPAAVRTQEEAGETLVP